MQIIFISFFAFANNTDWKQFNFKNIKYKLPKKWTVSSEIYGIEITAFGPIEGGEREAITIVSLDFHKNIEQNILLKNRDEYRYGREKYIAKKKGKLLKVENPEKIADAKNKISTYKMSVSYTINDTTFEEYSYLIECKSNLFQVKGMKRNPKSDDFKKLMGAIVFNFDCNS